MPDNVILNKGLESRLNSIPIQNGSITVTEDGQNLYVDFRNGVRTKITDVVILTSSTSEVDAPVNGKFYYVNSTKALYLYNNGFNPLVNPDDSGYVVISETASSAQFTFSDDGKTCTSTNDLVGNIYPNMKKGTIVIDPVGNVGLFKSYSSSSNSATLDVLVDNRATTTITGYEVYIDTNYEGTGYGTYEKPFNTWAAMEAKCLTDLKNASKPYTIYLKSGSNVTDLTEIDGYNNVVITGESKDTCSIASSSEFSITPGSTSTQKLEFKNLSLSFDNTFTIGETSGTIKIGEITFNNCKIRSTGTKAINLNLVSKFSFINCYFADYNNTIVNYNFAANVDTILFDNCTNLIINQMNTGSDITIKDCLHTTIAQLQSTQDMTFYIYNSTFITRSSFGTYAINLDDANAKCYFISGTLERTNDLVNIASNINQSIFLGTFNFQDKIPTIADNVLIANPGLDSLQVYDENSRTYLPTGGNLKEHLDAIGNKFSSLDTVTGDLEELVNTIQNAYKDENTFNLETEITGEHRTGDVWKYTGTNNLTLTSTITETVQVDPSTGSGETTTTPQFTFPNAKYFLKIGDQIKVGTTPTMIEVTNMQGDLITGSVGTAINTGEQSLSFDNFLSLSTGDRIIWIGNGWDKLSGSGNSEITDLGEIEGDIIVTTSLLNDVINKGIYSGTQVFGSQEVQFILFALYNYTSSDIINQILFLSKDIYVRSFIVPSVDGGAWTKILTKSDIKNNLTTTTTGSALDATQGKALNDKITTLDTRVTNAETKLSTVYKYKGSSTVANLPTSNQETGNVYNLTNDGTINASTEHEETVVAGDNVAWTGDYWDKLAGTINIPEGSMIQFITSGSVNDVNDEGLYYVNGDVSNLPDNSIATGRWFLICATSSGGSSQTAYSPTGYTYHRIKSGAMGSWESWQDITFYKSSTGDVTIGGKVNTTGTRDAGNVVIGSGATTVGDNGVVIGSASEITGTNNKNAIAIGYEAVSAANGAIQIGQGTNSTANTTQIGNYPLLDATGKIIEDRLPDSASGKKYSTIVIGNSGSGLTANDVDYLYEEGTDFGPVLTSAISKLTSSGAKGGEIKILSGTYKLSSARGTSTAPIKIIGEGKSTVITSDNPTDYYISASYCEISECKLATDIQITTNGYVNIHDCEIAERIYFNNSSTIQDIFIHDNNLDYTTTGKDFLYLSGSGRIYNFQVYNNYCYGNRSFDFLHAAAKKTICGSSIRNNHCPYGTWNSSTYDLNADTFFFLHNTMTGNTFYTINFSGNYWCISNNYITGNLYLYDGNYLDVINNKVVGIFTAASGLVAANITGNIINRIATESPYVNLGTNSRFVNNVIRNASFSTTYIPGHDTATNKWGNNMWADGIDQMIFANGEEIGGPLPVTYGVSIDLSDSNPGTSVTYTDDAIGMTPGSSDWYNTPIFSKIKPCLFKEGKVVGYLNPNNFAEFEDGTTADITSGTAGDVMIEIPKIGYKISTEDDILTVKITNDMNKKSEGFCYYAHTRDTEGDRDNLYIGAFLGSLVDNKLRSLSGKSPLSNETISSFRTKANANGSGYDQLAFYPLTLLQCLYLIMYKNLDSQTALGKGYVDGSSSTTTGATITNGMNYGTASTLQQMKFLGIEDFWGNLNQYIDGLYSNSTRNILTAFKDFNDTGSGYTDRGQGATTDVYDYMKAPQGNNESAFVIKTGGGSATTYFADYAYLRNDLLPVFGGGFDVGGVAGAFRLTVSFDSSTMSSNVSGRLMFL